MSNEESIIYEEICALHQLKSAYLEKILRTGLRNGIDHELLLRSIVQDNSKPEGDFHAKIDSLSKF